MIGIKNIIFGYLIICLIVDSIYFLMMLNTEWKKGEKYFMENLYFFSGIGLILFLFFPITAPIVTYKLIREKLEKYFPENQERKKQIDKMMSKMFKNR